MFQSPLLRQTRQPKDVFPGVYSAVVEANQDPTKCGRLRVRIPDITGTEADTRTRYLTWARPCLPFGGGRGYGSYVMPLVGSTVWVAFEHGDPNYPVWLGTWPGVTAEPRPMLRDTWQETPEGPVSMSAAESEPWMAPAGPEAPIEGLRQLGHQPDTYVIFKSPKGATFVVEDQDEGERTQLLGRAGEGLSMDAPVSVAENDQNKAARELRSAHEGNPLTVKQLANKEALLTLTDIGGQQLKMVSGATRSEVILTSKAAPTEEETPENLQAASIQLYLSATDQMFRISIVKNGIETGQLFIDGATGGFSVKTSRVITLDAPTVILPKDLVVVGDIDCIGDVRVTGTVSSAKDGNVTNGSARLANDLAIPEPSI